MSIARSIRGEPTAVGHTAVSGDHLQRVVAARPVVTVIGDLMLDCWLHGRSSRLAREAPVAVVEHSSEDPAPGGAANTAVNLAALGARVRLVGVVGDDETGDAVLTLLATHGVDISGVIRSPLIATTKKTRIVVDDQILLRLDTVPADSALTACAADCDDELARRATAAMSGSDALVIADYGGVVRASGLAAGLAEAARPRLVVVDAHDPRHWRGLRPTVVTPNAAEVEHTLTESFRSHPQRVEIAARLAPALAAATDAASVVITLDRDGAVAVDEDGACHTTVATPAPERQASGAGDTFVAGLTVALSGGLPLPVAADVAQLAANVAIDRPGTSLCSREDLLALLGPARHARPEPAEAASEPRRTVLTLGRFDPFDAAHSAFLSAAAGLGSYLVVALDRSAAVDDESLSFETRMRLLQTHPDVDLVAEFSADASDLVSSLGPDVIAVDQRAVASDVDSTGLAASVPVVDLGAEDRAPRRVRS